MRSSLGGPSWNCFESLMKTRTMVIALGVVGLASTVIFVPTLVRPRAVSARNACVGGLYVIAHEKEAWARRTKASTGSIPTLADLFGTNAAAWPMCPAGGKYDPGAVNQRPTCSIGPPAHVLPPP